MPSILNFLLRAALLAAGLVFAASLLLVSVILIALWSLRTLWARLTGRPTTPFIMRFGPRAAFEEMARRARPQPSRTPRADAAAGPRGRLADVTDVEPRESRG